ncbi:hypothetical protein [Bilifractor sp. HCP3S3_D3]|uniref:hypothetical protein n=1 Tax=unclassified Bilifractor TaxID=2815795 RepID=UPI003F897A75
MTEEEIRQRNEERRAKLDAVSRRNMEKCAAFIARMIEKYGREVLAEIEEDDVSVADWIYAAVNGNVQSHGLALLEK